MREAWSLMDTGLAGPEDIDAAVKYGSGMRYLAAGPVLQKDLAGLDIHCAAATSIRPTLANNDAPPQALRDKVAQGKLGMMITLPIFMPIVQKSGIDQVWFGVTFLICMPLGLLLPPHGLLLMTMKGVSPLRSRWPTSFAQSLLTFFSAWWCWRWCISCLQSLYACPI